MNAIIKTNGITYGVILGIILSLSMTILYLIDLKLLVSMWNGVLNLILSIALAVYLMMITKKEMVNITFKEGFTTIFLFAAVALLISTFFNYLLFNIIDPDAKAKMMEHLIVQTEDALAKYNTPQDVANKAINDLKTKDFYSPSYMLLSYVTGLLTYSVLGLIIAAIFKSKPPQEIN